MVTEVQGQVVEVLPVLHSAYALIGFRGLTLPRCPRRVTQFSKPLKNKGISKESMTKVGLDALGTSTPLESNKSLDGNNALYIKSIEVPISTFETLPGIN
jgi:hypothetical protein